MISSLMSLVLLSFGNDLTWNELTHFGSRKISSFSEMSSQFTRRVENQNFRSKNFHVGFLLEDLRPFLYDKVSILNG